MNHNPLYFRNQRYGGEIAQRDHVQYEIRFAHWIEGKEADRKYFVVRSDAKNQDYLTTENVRRFTTSEEAKQFCQDIYDGKVDLAALKAEIKAFKEANDTQHRAAIQNDVDRFKAHLAAAGASLPVFVDALKVWDGLMEDARRAAYNETKEENANV